MGYPDGYYYGQGRIICDTSTFSVGDTIRVRSMTDSSKVWNQQVATVGTALVFTVPCYDYYKICTVQDIGGVATEVGGVYKTVDYGQTLFIKVLDKTTLGGIQGILNAHQEGTLLDIGDEVTITVNGANWIMQVANIDTTNHAIDFVSKNIYSMSATAIDYTTSNLRANAQAFYTSIDNSDKQYIKEVTRTCRANAYLSTYSDYVWVAGMEEITGNGMGIGQSQFPIFVTQANRIKTFNGTANSWWTDDAWTQDRPYRIVTDGGYLSDTVASYPLGLVPCFRLTADS